jgi:hypothetical protein
LESDPTSVRRAKGWKSDARQQCAPSQDHSEVESIFTEAVIESVDGLLLFIPLPVEKLILKRVLLL